MSTSTGVCTHAHTLDVMTGGGVLRGADTEEVTRGRNKGWRHYLHVAALLRLQSYCPTNARTSLRRTCWNNPIAQAGEQQALTRTVAHPGSRRGRSEELSLSPGLCPQIWDPGCPQTFQRAWSGACWCHWVQTWYSTEKGREQSAAPSNIWMSVI